MLLAIDTSTRNGGVALWKEGKAAFSICWHSARNHTQELMPAIQTLLASSKLKLQDLHGIGIALGPGGFSALRVGLSTAKGLAMPLNLPLVGIGTLEMEAYPYRSTGLRIQPILDIGRGDVATARYGSLTSGWTKLTDECISDPLQLLDSIVEPTIICGEGLLNHQEALRNGLPQDSILLPFTSSANRLSALGELAEAKISADEVKPIATLEPLYLRRPNIGPPKVLQRIQL